MTSTKQTARTIPYGSIKDPDTGEVVEDPGQQAIIDRIIRERVYEVSFQGIANTLNDEEIPPARGGKWHGSAVKNIWDVVPMARFERILEEDEKKEEAAKKVELAKAKAAQEERERLLSPEHQFKTRSYYIEQTSEINTATGEVGGHTERWDDKEKWDNYQTRDAEQLARSKALSKAMHDEYMALTDKERADLHTFNRPFKTGFGGSLQKVDEVVQQETERVGEEINAIIDEIKDQSGVKRRLRNALKLLLAELAIQRQFALHYHQERDKAREAGKAGGEEADTAPA